MHRRQQRLVRLMDPIPALILKIDLDLGFSAYNFQLEHDSSGKRIDIDLLEDRIRLALQFPYEFFELPLLGILEDLLDVSQDRPCIDQEFVDRRSVQFILLLS